MEKNKKIAVDIFYKAVQDTDNFKIFNINE